MAQNIAGAHGITSGGFNDREVHTAKMQANAGAVNAGMSEEERAAKAGYAAQVDTAYVAAHQADYAGQPACAQKRVGSFMAVGLDLDGYSQKRSALCPYDADIGVKKLENWERIIKTDPQPRSELACARMRGHEKQIIQRKKWQCHRQIVIVRYENSTSNQVAGGKP